MSFFNSGPNSLKQLWSDVCSKTPELHNNAMRELIRRAKKDETGHREVLQVLMEGLEYGQDPWVPARAAKTIDAIADRSAAREVWNRLLHHPRVEIATHAAMTIADPALTPDLIAILSQRTEINIRVAAMNALARLRDPAGFPAIAKHLAAPEMRVYAIEALANLGDMRAIPLLETLLQDETEVPGGDDRGAAIRICDIADEAIRRVRTRPLSL
jgi:HEAT repeat protein